MILPATFRGDSNGSGGHQHHSECSCIFKNTQLIVFAIWLNMLKATLHLWTPEVWQHLQPQTDIGFHGRSGGYLVP